MDNLERKQGMVRQFLADNLPRPESLTARDARIDAGDDLDPTDDEIIDAMNDLFGMDRGQCIERLAKFDFAAARAKLALPGGQHYSTTTFKENGEPILLNADGSRSIFCDVDD